MKTNKHADKNAETISGSLSQVIFSNQETHFIIANFAGDSGTFIALGNLPNAQPGMTYDLTGEWQENKKYGKQFKFNLYHVVEPTDAAGIFKYIVRICKFVGPAIGNMIVDRYQEKTLEVLKTDPECVSNDIKGITQDRAIEIQTELLKHAEYEQVMVKLESLLSVPGMRKTLITDLLKKYEHEAADRVLENPYMLVQFHGIGFFLADKVAIINAEFPRDSLERKKAATLHAMKAINQDGHIWVGKEQLIEAVYELIQVKDLVLGLEALLVDEVMVEDAAGDIAFADMARDEQNVAEMLVALERVVAA